MSESNLVSPLLDGFALGAPMSSRPGVCCCPAMKEGSDQKYIVKILSMPASQTQLDALLLTGAYKDPAAALDYYRQERRRCRRRGRVPAEHGKAGGLLQL